MEAVVLDERSEDDNDVRMGARHLHVTDLAEESLARSLLPRRRLRAQPR